MTTSIYVITPDNNLARYVGLLKEALVPKDIRSKDFYKSLGVVISSYFLDPRNPPEGGVDRFFVENSDLSESVILLCDSSLLRFVRHLSPSFFVVSYEFPFNKSQVKNFFGMKLSKIIKVFSYFSGFFENEKFRKLLLLPLRNFNAQELTDLRLLFTESVDIDLVRSTMETILSRLRERQKPKTEKSDRMTYMVDDRENYFSYGNERHSLPDSKIPPHNESCVLSAHFRFGKRYDHQRHFNVSKGSAHISGQFADCHDSTLAISARMHLNIFPNDFVV